MHYVFGDWKNTEFFRKGFIGDKLGYRVILIVYLLISGAAATAFHFVPRCGEQKLEPHALLYSTITDQNPQFLSVNWALCDGKHANLTSTLSMSRSSCTEFLATIDLTDLPRYLNCTGKDNNSSADFKVSGEFGFVNATVMSGPNGTFCTSKNEYFTGFSFPHIEGQGSIYECNKCSQNIYLSSFINLFIWVYKE